ncbi:MAG: dephospho-CoA kinase [Candidatus Gracilibacteria bacterium]
MKKDIIGLAGFMGSGKSLAGHFFEKLGAAFIDADEVVDDLYQQGNEGYRKLVNYFGDDFLKKNGEIDRKKLADFLFDDKHKLRIVNDLIHPIVTAEIQKRIDALDVSKIFLEGTYFKPEHLGRLVKDILWLATDKETLKERVVENGKMKEDLFEKILKVQEKPKDVTEEIDNNGTIDELYDHLKKWWDKRG